MTTRKLKSKSRKQSRKITHRKLTRKYNKIQNGGNKTYEDFMKVTDLCKNADGEKRDKADVENNNNDHQQKSIKLKEVFNGTNKLAKGLLEKIKNKYYKNEELEGNPDDSKNANIIIYKLIPFRVATALYRIYRYNDFIPSFASFALFGSKKTIKDKIMKVYKEELNFINKIIADEKEIIPINCDYKTNNNNSNHDPQIPMSYK